jgi:hypothetical protein
MPSFLIKAVAMSDFHDNDLVAFNAELQRVNGQENVAAGQACCSSRDRRFRELHKNFGRTGLPV